MLQLQQWEHLLSYGAIIIFYTASLFLISVIRCSLGLFTLVLAMISVIIAFNYSSSSCPDIIHKIGKGGSEIPCIYKFNCKGKDHEFMDGIIYYASY